MAIKEIQKKEPSEAEKMAEIAQRSGYAHAYPVTVGRDAYIVLSNERAGTSFHDIRTALGDKRLLSSQGKPLNEMEKKRLDDAMVRTGKPAVAEKMIEHKEVGEEEMKFTFAEACDEYTQNRIKTELGEDGFAAIEAHLNGKYEMVEALAEKNKTMHPDFAWKTQVVAECLKSNEAGNLTLVGEGIHALEVMKEVTEPEERVYSPSKKAVNVIPLDLASSETINIFEKQFGPWGAYYAYLYFNEPKEFLEQAHPQKKWEMQQIFEKLKKGEDGAYYLTKKDVKELEALLKKTPGGERVFDEDLFLARNIPEEKAKEVIGPEGETVMAAKKEEYPEEIKKNKGAVAEVIGPGEKPKKIAEKEEYPETVEEKGEEAAEVIGPEMMPPKKLAKKEEYPETIEGKGEAAEVIGPGEEYPGELKGKKGLVAEVIGPVPAGKKKAEVLPEMVITAEEIDITPAALGIEEKKVAAKELGLTKESLTWIEETFGADNYASIKKAADLYHQGKAGAIKDPVLKNLAKMINENAVFEAKTGLFKLGHKDTVLASHIEMQNKGEFLMASEAPPTPVTRLVSVFVAKEGEETKKITLAFDAELYAKAIAVDPKDPAYKYKREAVLANLDNAVITLEGKQITANEAKKLIGI